MHMVQRDSEWLDGDWFSPSYSLFHILVQGENTLVKPVVISTLRQQLAVHDGLSAYLREYSGAITSGAINITREILEDLRVTIQANKDDLVPIQCLEGAITLLDQELEREETV